MKKIIISRPKLIMGFTMVEVMVVIGVIAILTVIIFPSISRIRAKNRDAEKVSDISTIQLGLSLYYAQTGTYPASLGETSFKKYVPSDSLISPNDQKYIYVPLKRSSDPSDKCTYYHLGALLELQNPQINISDSFSTEKGNISNNYEYCGGYSTDPDELGIIPTKESDPNYHMYHVRPN